VSEKRLLLVEDEPGLQLALSDRLSSEGYAVETAGDGNVAVQRATGEPFDIIVLDVMLPGRDGFDVARAIRQQGIQTPILMLTARTQVVDRVVGLKLGADDYLTKPFETIELLARLEALLRRAPSAVSGLSLERYQFGDIAVDAARSLREGISPAEVLHRASRRHHLARRAAARSLGLRQHAVDANRRRSCGVAAAEARAESAGAAVHPHRSRPRL
jgi:DNA-binding response OmpR family regulator